MCCRVLCYGDSNTYGYDPHSCFGGQYPDTIRWTALLEKQGWKVFNEGENGRPLPRHQWEVDLFLKSIRQLNPDITAIMLGSNDLLQGPGISAETCAARAEKFLKYVLDQRLTCEFLLVAPPPMTLGAWVGDSITAEASRRLSEYYETAANRLSIHFADAGSWNIGLAYDGVHFSETGHRAFAEEMDQALKCIAAKSGQGA